MFRNSKSNFLRYKLAMVRKWRIRKNTFFEKATSKFYRRQYDLISKIIVGLKTHLREGLSEPEFYGALVYKLKKLIGPRKEVFFFSIQKTQTTL